MLSSNKTINSWWSLPAIMGITLALAFFITYLTPVRQLEQKITDQLFEIRGPIPIQDTTVVLVAISQQADQEIPYKYPWPVNLYAKLIENLNKAGARAIGIDVTFDETDRYNPVNDSLFARTLQKYGNVVLAGDIQTETKFRGGGSQSVTTRMIRPNTILSEANPNPIGLVKVVKDLDEEVRNYVLWLDYSGQRYYSMGIELLKIYKGLSDRDIRNGRTYFQEDGYSIPKFNLYSMAINYVGPPGSFPTYSFDNVIDDSTVRLSSEDVDFQSNTFSDPDFGLLKSGVFKDKIVLVGANMPELHDYHATPFAQQGNMAGFEVHANALQTILSGQYIRYAPGWLNLLLIALVSASIVLLIRKTSGGLGFLLYIVLGTLIAGSIVMVFVNFNYILNLSRPLIALTIGYVSTTSYQYLTEQREKRRIREMFSSYVSPDLVNRMIESGEEPQLGGDEVCITAFFSDIESFSTFSEKLKPNELVGLINEYLSAMTDIITDEGGTLDKYIGDAIVAFFGAPARQEKHAYQACIVSQLMQKKLEELKERWKKEGDKWPEIVHHMRNRIGINTGLMVTGNMGSLRRFNYTIMGDNVNLAARCESGAKKFGIYTMVTKETKEEAEKHGDRCVFRFLDRIVVKGRTQPVDVFEIMGFREDLTEQNIQCLNLFEQGIKHYQNLHWEKAIQCFEQSEKQERFQPGEKFHIETNPSLVYLERCIYMKHHPPAEQWDGVYIMETK